MPLIPAPYRCAVSLGLDCETITGPDRAFLVELAGVVEDHGGRLQLFMPDSALEQAPDTMQELVRRGHAVDPRTPGGMSLVDVAAETLQEQLAQMRACFQMLLPEGSVGLRAGQMIRGGLQRHEAAQQAVVASGVRFISSDYSTREPEDPVNPGFADKNAAMLIKHSQPRRYPGGLLEIPSPGYSDRSFLERQGRSLDEWMTHQQACVDFICDLGGLLYAPLLHLDTQRRHDPDLRAVRALLSHAAGKRDPVRLCTFREVWEWASTG